MKSLIAVLFAFTCNSALGADLAAGAEDGLKYHDGSIGLGPDPFFSQSSTMIVDGVAAMLLIQGMRKGMSNGATNITDANGLVMGPNFGCRQVIPSAYPQYICAATFNSAGKGELTALDPNDPSLNR